MNDDTIEALLRRVQRLEDEAEIRRLVMTYGPCADAGMAAAAGQLWIEDGEYDWDATGTPYIGGASVEAMLRTDAHLGLIGAGAAHFAGPLLIRVSDDTATAVNYSLIMRRDEQRFYLWRVSAVRWDLERLDSTWRVRRRTNRLLDESGAGRDLFADTLTQLASEGSL